MEFRGEHDVEEHDVSESVTAMTDCWKISRGGARRCSGLRVAM
jgi:hypothetical protein